MLYLNELKISLDRRERGSDIDFISHAHSDHIASAKSSKQISASVETIQLLERARNIKVKGVCSDSRIRLLDSGHMLGAKQLCIENDHLDGRIVYSGDFQLQRSRTAKPIEIVDTDYLILDSTYGDPDMKFEDKAETESAMQEWVLKRLESGIVVFNVYAMGKAQELIAVLNDAGIVPAVTEKIGMVSGVYRNNGIDLAYASPSEMDGSYEEITRDNFVMITEGGRLDTLKAELQQTKGRRVYTAVATGWASAYKFDTDAQFPFSDHADFSQSKEYIDAAGAKCVFAYGPQAERFAANLTACGYNAKPFSEYEGMVQKAKYK